MFGERTAQVFDAVIVGAGPAGSYLAYLLAGEGLRVAIIDKARFPREKVCGGGISHKTADLIDFDITPVVHATIHEAIVTYQNRAAFAAGVNRRPGYTVVRGEFDDFLLRHAVNRGARFFPETVLLDIDQQQGDDVVAITSAGALRGRYLFGADGVASRVRKLVFGAGLVTYAPALEALVPVPDDERDKFGQRVLFDLGGMRGGYGWIFPKKDHLNVGVYAVSGAKGLRRELAAFMDRYACLRRFGGQAEYRGYPIPVRNEHKVFERRRVWLLGDAAGLAESVFGEGIYFAVKSAAMAYQVLREGGFAPSEGAYNALLRRELLPELHFSELLGRFVFNYPQFAFERMGRSVYVNRCFTDMVTGAIGYRDCFFKTVLAFPFWLFTSRYPYFRSAHL